MIVVGLHSLVDLNAMLFKVLLDFLGMVILLVDVVSLPNVPLLCLSLCQQLQADLGQLLRTQSLHTIVQSSQHWRRNLSAILGRSVWTFHKVGSRCGCFRGKRLVKRNPRLTLVFADRAACACSWDSLAPTRNASAS